MAYPIIIDKSPEGITKQIWKSQKNYKCDFCGGYIWKGEGYRCTVDFVKHKVWKSCNKCNHGIIYLYGD